MMLEDILFEMADIKDSDFIEPHMQILTGDEPVGEVPRELRKLYTLFLQTQAESHARLKPPTVLDAAMGYRWGPECYWIMHKAEVLRLLFFLSLYDLVCPDKSWDFNHLAVRKGWKAVREPS